MFNHTVEFVSDKLALTAALERLDAAPVIALDIETIYWWDRESERVSLIQLAFRESDGIRVVVIDSLADFDPESLRRPLELSAQIKAIHNAGFDAVKLSHHFRIATSPIHDTMLAARRGGERRCSLKAQVEAHLGFHLDKTEQRGDWSRRPLTEEQLNYASLDAVCTLLLYEKQIARGLRGDYQLRARIQKTQQSLSLVDVAPRVAAPDAGAPELALLASDLGDLNPCAFALLGVIAELDGRYSPEHLVASVRAERVGLAGWIIDHTLGADADIDEMVAKQEIAALIDLGLARLSLSRKLEATAAGAKLWTDHKPVKK
ncbi:MAG TPA: ribonuclease D [Blastocatellia bacterium]|nr:ribonuclease D [Blastocatellia bacterium]